VSPTAGLLTVRAVFRGSPIAFPHAIDSHSGRLFGRYADPPGAARRSARTRSAGFLLAARAFTRPRLRASIGEHDRREPDRSSRARASHLLGVSTGNCLPDPPRVKNETVMERGVDRRELERVVLVSFANSIGTERHNELPIGRSVHARARPRPEGLRRPSGRIRCLGSGPPNVCGRGRASRLPNARAHRGTLDRSRGALPLIPAAVRARESNPLFLGQVSSMGLAVARAARLVTAAPPRRGRRVAPVRLRDCRGPQTDVFEGRSRATPPGRRPAAPESSPFAAKSASGVRAIAISPELCQPPCHEPPEPR
jgi:hypothetical protein